MLQQNICENYEHKYIPGLCQKKAMRIVESQVEQLLGIPYKS